MNEVPIFIFSLDTELLWGYSDHPHEKIVSRIINDNSYGRKGIDLLLSLFERYDIPSTWAIVGNMFLNYEEIKNNPKFYPLINIPDLYSGKDIINKILNSRVNHEIGYHSFSHINYEKCSSLEAETELLKGLEIAKQNNLTLRSFVFPRNKVGHIDLLKKYGFLVFRGNTLSMANPDENPIIMLCRATVGKCIAPPTKPIFHDGIWEIPCSMWFGDPKFKFSVVPKAKLGIYRTIYNKSIFHIYLHPHDLLLYNTLINDLDKFLSFVAKLRDNNKIKIMTMGEAVNTFKPEICSE